MIPFQILLPLLNSLLSGDESAGEYFSCHPQEPTGIELVGEIHHNEDHLKRLRQKYQEALNGETFFLLEGLADDFDFFDEAKLTRRHTAPEGYLYLTKLSDPQRQKARIFGTENQFILLMAEIGISLNSLLSYKQSNPALLPTDPEAAKAFHRLLKALIHNSTPLRQIHEELALSKKEDPRIVSLIPIFEFLKYTEDVGTIKSRERLEKLLKSPPFKDIYQMVNTFAFLGTIMIALADDSDKKEVSGLQSATDYFSKGTAANWTKFRAQIVIDARNEVYAKRIGRLYCQAVKEGKSLYFQFGRDHLNGLRALLEPEARKKSIPVNFIDLQPPPPKDD